MAPAVIGKREFHTLFDSLSRGYSVIGPRVKDGVITLDEITYDDIPSGFKDSQGPGVYRLQKGDSSIFSFVNGPDSFKKFLLQSFRTIHHFQKTKRGSSVSPYNDDARSYVFFGVRACDIKALGILDRVFSGIAGTDYEYHKIREKALIVALNCTQPGENCFCVSMNAGPEVKDGFDIAITEMNDVFFIEAGTEKGKHFTENLSLRGASSEEIAGKKRLIDRCKASMGKTMEIDDLPGFLYRHFDHSHWNEAAERCLACGNCTQVCPTCFCVTAFDYLDLSGIKTVNDFAGRRIRVWDSCFSKNFARVHGGNFRSSRWARYRHWLNHKLGYWIEQFGVIGCTGCGRCITWCPVGIDITEEMQKLRNKS